MIPSYSLFVRQIAREVAALKRVELPDVVGISSRLLILEESVSQMEITEPHAGKAQAPEIGGGDTSPIPEKYSANVTGCMRQTLANLWLFVVVMNPWPH